MGVIRTVLAVDGEAKFRNSMKEVNSTLKAMQANVKALSSEYTTNSTKAENLRKQNEQLTKVQEQQQEKIKLLKAAVERSGEAYKNARENLGDMILEHGAESEAAEKARKALASASATHNNYRTQLAQTEQALNETNTALRNNAEELDKLNRSSSLGRGFTEAVSKLGSTVKTVTKVEFEAFKTSIKAVSGEFEIALKGLTAYTSAVTSTGLAVGGFAIKAGSDFEQSISKLGAISGASAEDMKKLEAAAKETGVSTSKSASESADALTYMALAGWKTEDMLKGLNPIVRASEAGAMDLATASDLITDSLAAYGKNADDLSQYLDIVAKAQSNSNTSMQEMLEAYVEVAGTFKNLNVPMEESAGLLGILANRGIKGSEAGNKLSSTLINLVGANKNAASAMDALGVSAWDDNGEFIGLSETIKRLGTALENVTDEELVKFEAKIGGKMQIDTLQALIAGTSGEFDGLVEALENSKGALQETADEMLNNFNGAVTLAKSAVEGLGISIFGTFGTQLRENVQELTGWASAIAKTIENKGSLVGVIQLIAKDARSSLKKNIIDISKSLPEITKVFNKVIFEMADTFLQTSTMAVSGIMPKFIDGFFKLANGLIDRLPEFAEELGFGIKKLFDELIPRMKEFSDNLVSELPEMLDNFLSFFDGEGAGKIFNAGIDILMTLIKGIAENLPVLIREGAEMLMSMIEGIVDQLPELIDTAVDILLTIVDTIVDNLDEIVAVALKILIALIEGIVKNLDKIIAKVPEILSAIVDAIIDNLDLIIKAAVEIVLALGDALVQSVGLLWDAVVEIPKYISDRLGEVDWFVMGTKIIMGIADGFTNVGSYVKDKVSEAGSFILGEFTSFFDIHSPSRKARDMIGKNIGYGIAEGTSNGLEESDYTINRAAADYATDLADATKSAYLNANISFSPNAETSRTVTVENRFENVYINNNMDIEEVSYRLAETTKSYLVGEGT